MATILAAALALSALAPSTLLAQEPPPLPTPAPAAPAGPVGQTAPAAPAPSQPAPSAEPGERIVGIRVVGYQTVSPDTIAHYLGIKVGDPYEPDKIRANFRALWDVGLLENLQIDAERGAGGVTLVITIEERPVIKLIEFNGNKKLSSSQIRDKLKEAKVEILPGSPLSLKDLSKMRAAIYDFYMEQGFRSASVDFKIEDISKTEKKVTFVIDEGDKVKIESIKFTGNDHVSAQSLRNAMHKTKVAVWWRLLSENTTYSQANYEADVESMKGVYQSKGFKDVVFKDPKLEVYVVNPNAKKQKRRVRITIPVVEGDKFFVNEIRITRTEKSGQPAENPDPTVIAKQALLKKFHELRPGSVLNRDRLIEALMQIEQSYKARGYIFWFADPVYKEVGNHRVDIDIQMYEGDKYYLGRLEVQGNTQTRDKVIRREFALDEGDVMNMEAVKKSVQKIEALGYFKMGEEPGFSVREEEKKVDVVIKGQETSRNEVQFGAGYSAFDGFFGQFSFQTRNFLGRGEIIGASAQIGKVSNYVDLSYTVPWWLDRNQTVGASLYRRKVDYLSIDELTEGGSVFYSKGIGLFDAASLLYSYENIDANFPVRSAQTPPGQPPPPQKFSETTGKTSGITPAYRYDSRNDPFDPNRGFRLNASVLIAPKLLGSETQVIKPLIGSTLYIPVPFPRLAVLALNVEGGWVHPLNDTELPIFERFQLGGEQSLRGFQQGAVVPVHPKTYEVFTDEFQRILGGNKFFVINIEYQFLQAGPAKLLAFMDIGNNFHESQNFSFQNVRTAAGMELRVFLPIFQAPLRFIYAFNLHPIQPIDQFGFPIDYLKEKKSGFTFSIGRTF
ncbi:MAG TPA: outer membrane protein assembly factor BamA [Thermoanaerobaculia bacterium]